MANQEEWWNLPAFAPFFQGQKKQGNGRSGQYGYTGTGADTAIQPSRRVPGVGNGTYDGHEGEFVFDANATQAIGPDVLESIRQGAKTGQVDPNSLRQAIGQPRKPGMRTGGFIDVTGRTTTDEGDATRVTVSPGGTQITGELSNVGNVVPTPEPVSINTSGLRTPTGPGQAVATADNAFFGIDTSGIKAPPQKRPVYTPTRDAAGNLPGESEVKGLGSSIYYGTGVAKGDSTVPTIAQQPQAVNPSTMGGNAVATGVKAVAGAPKFNSAGQQVGVWTQEEIDARAPKPVEEQTAEVGVRDEAIDYMRDMMQGDNPYMENIANRYLQDIGGAGAAAYAGAKQEMARAGMGKEAIASGLASQRRDTSSAVAGAAGEMAGKSMELAAGAAKDLEAAGRWDAEWGAGESDRMINDAAAMTFPEWQKLHPNATKDDYDRSARMGELAYQTSAMGLNTVQMASISQMINSNTPFDVVSAKFKEYTGRDMTQAEYNQMQTATPFGATIFGREKGLADQLITQGGAENIARAGEIYADLYPGVGIDWSTVISADNSARFSTAMSDLGKIMATAGNDIEEAMTLIESSGLGSTFRQLGIDGGKLEKLYQGLTVNKIDEEWSAIEESDAYQSLVGEDPEFAAELKNLWARNKLGVEEMNIFDKFNIVDSKGNILATVAGEEAANDKAEELGGTAVKTGKKTMVLTDNETGSTYGGSVDIPKGAKQGDVWVDGGIAYEFDSELGATPTTYAEPFDRVADKLYAMGPTIDGEKNPYYDDIINGRAAAYVSGTVRLNPGDLSVDDPVYKRILNDTSVTKGIGSQQIDKTGVQSGEHHYFTTFQPSDGAAEIAQGTLLNIDNKLYSYAGSLEENPGGHNRMWYYLIDMATGEKYQLRAQGDLSETTPTKA
jgi:hypothetical protein